MAGGRGTCLHCRRVVGLSGRGLCSPCYRRVRHLYPARRRGPQPAVSKQAALCGLPAAVVARVLGVSRRAVDRAAKRKGTT